MTATAFFEAPIAATTPSVPHVMYVAARHGQCGAYPDTTLAAFTPRRKKTPTTGRVVPARPGEVARVRVVSDGPVETLSDYWLFVALDRAVDAHWRASHDLPGDGAVRRTADAARLRLGAVQAEIRKRGFVLSAADLREDDVVWHPEHGWCHVHGEVEPEWESVWLYPENMPRDVEYDGGYYVEVFFDDVDRGQMRLMDTSSPPLRQVD